MKPCVPCATYRVQLNSSFGLQDAAERIPYLASLGISTIYCSPVLQARCGSTHGYDTTDPTRISDDLGGDEAWNTMLAAAHDYGLTVLLDIVPNHMAASTQNPWWRDVLEHGRLSPFAIVFDIDWAPPVPRLKNRVVLPQLPRPLKDVLDDGGLTVGLTPSGLVLRFGQTELPLDVRSYRHVLAPLLRLRAGELPERLVDLIQTLEDLLTIDEMPGNDPESHYAVRCRIKSQLMELIHEPAVSSFATRSPIEEIVRGAAACLGPKSLRRLLREQNYVLEYWKSGRHTLNYRRFFTINELVGVRVEDQRVFGITHGLLRELARSDSVCGFRVDHIDGLRQPLQYLRRLRTIEDSPGANSATRQPYLVVEKILSGDELLPPAWPVEGTSGYDFLNEVIGLFILPAGLPAILRQHQTVTHSLVTRSKLTFDNQCRVLTESFQPELSRLARLLAPLARWLYPASEITAEALAESLVDVTAALSVYRTYYRGTGHLAEGDRRYVEQAVSIAEDRRRAVANAFALRVVHRALTLDIPDDAPALVRRAVREHLLRWQQLSGAAMAKGFEDTTLYQDSVLLALNDVGSRSSLGVTTLDNFHRWNQQRRKDWPHTMNCTATHDTKRGEDVRARLAVLSEMPDAWHTAVNRWQASLQTDETTANLVRQARPATHMFLLQTVVGAWPEGGTTEEFAARLAAYMTKVAREAKVHSSWDEPNEEHEQALTELVTHALRGKGAVSFHECFDNLIDSVRFHGLVNSLSQVLLKATCPGVPDFYQGTELLDLSLVDPDNRRPVDYDLRESLLAQLDDAKQDRLSAVAQLTENWPDEKAKFYVTTAALRFRLAHRDLFENGSYTPLYSDGVRKDEVCAFSRNHRGTNVIVIVPLRSPDRCGRRKAAPGCRCLGRRRHYAAARQSAVIRERPHRRDDISEGRSPPSRGCFEVIPRRTARGQDPSSPDSQMSMVSPHSAGRHSGCRGRS